MNYRHLLFVLFLLVCPVLFGQAQSVTPIATGKSKFIGCAYSSAQSLNFQNYWNQITPENGGKWGSAERTRNVMSWSEMDASYNLAKKYGMTFKAHTLIWGAQQPSWIGALDTASQRKEIEQWFSLLAARYPDIDQIDVVNEPIHNAPNGMVPWGSTTKNVDYAKALGGTGKTGYDWIVTSFRLARKYFPKSKLIINEYSVINSSTTTKQYVDMIKILQADSLIDGIGEQAHAFTTSGATAATMKANLNTLAATGLPIYLTEVDIDGATDLAQLTEMQRVIPVFWEHPAVAGITFWGFRNGMWRSEQKAYLISTNGLDRPAMKWLKAYINDTVAYTKSITLSTSNGKDTIDIKGGTLNMVASVLPVNATIPNVTWSVSPTNRAKIDANGLLTALADGIVTVTATAWDGSKVKGSKNIVIANQSVSVFDNALAEQVTVYPNPSSDGCFSISGIGSFSRIDLFDLTGKHLACIENKYQPVVEIRKHLSQGVYLLHLSNESQQVIKKIAVN